MNEELEKKQGKWARIRTMIENDEGEISGFNLRLPNESAKAFNTRRKHYVRGFVNYVQDMVTAPVNALFQKAPVLAYDDDSSMLAEFGGNVTNSKEEPQGIEEYFKSYAGVNMRAFGIVFVVIDKPSEMSENLADEIENGKPYINLIQPEDVIDWDYKNAEFVMFKYRVVKVPKWTDYTEDPPGAVEYEYTWTVDTLYKKEIGREDNYIEEIPHTLGTVPVVAQATFKTDDRKVLGNSSMEQTTNMLLSYNDNLHYAGYEIKKVSGAILLVPEGSKTSANVTVDATGNVTTKKQDNGTTMEYRGKEKPAYLIKGATIEEAMTLARYYQVQAYENERDQKSVSKMGATGQKVAESGFAKVLEREPLILNIISFALDGDSLIRKIMNKVAFIVNEKTDSFQFAFNKEYDFTTEKERYETIKVANDPLVQLGKVTPTATKAMYRNAVKDVTRDTVEKEKINAEIEEYQPEQLEKDVQDAVLKEFSDEDENK